MGYVTVSTDLGTLEENKGYLCWQSPRVQSLKNFLAQSASYSS